MEFLFQFSPGSSMRLCQYASLVNETPFVLDKVHKVVSNLYTVVLMPGTRGEDRVVIELCYRVPAH